MDDNLPRKIVEGEDREVTVTNLISMQAAGEKLVLKCDAGKKVILEKAHFVNNLLKKVARGVIGEIIERYLPEEVWFHSGYGTMSRDKRRNVENLLTGEAKKKEE